MLEALDPPNLFAELQAERIKNEVENLEISQRRRPKKKIENFLQSQGPAVSLETF